jgi:hypothetical protein
MSFDADPSTRPGGYFEVVTLGQLNRKLRIRPKLPKQLSFEISRMPRSDLEKLLVVSGKVGHGNVEAFEHKCREIGCDFVADLRGSWVFTHKTIMENYDKRLHKGVLLIGDNKAMPGTRISYHGAYAFTDWFLQDLDGDGIPDVPVGRIFGPRETVLYHLDPYIVDSNIAVVFDSQPGRSDRHAEGLRRLGFNVQILSHFRKEFAQLLAYSEFILQFSDGVFTSRIHGTPDRWATHSKVILSHAQVLSIAFQGYPVVYSEACNTAQEGPLLRAFLDRGAVYIGSTLDTLNNTQPFDDWRSCPYADGWKFGFLDLLDSYDHIGEVKVAVDRALAQNIDANVIKELENVRQGNSNDLTKDHSASISEWVLYGNPLRRTTVGPNADFTPGRLVVDT